MADVRAASGRLKQMIKLGRYREFLPEWPEIANTLPSIYDSFSSAEYEGQKDVERYLLRGGKQTAAFMGSVYDVTTGELIQAEAGVRNDGAYEWPMSLAYYVRKYNLKPPDEFIRHALSR